MGISGARSSRGRGPTASTISAAPSGKPVAVCLDRPLLSLDRPFTYVLPDDLEASTGSLVQVAFHGRTVRGWVLGETDDVPPRVVAVKKVVSRVRFFDDSMLDLFRWVSERYIAPLAAVIARSHPPRVASEEHELGAPRPEPPATFPMPNPTGVAGLAAAGPLAAYRGGPGLTHAIEAGEGGSFVLRPAPEDEQLAAVEAVRACLRGGRRAIVLVPEADPVPATAAAILEACGDRVAMFLGGDRRRRYRTWLDVAAGGYDVVVGTRPSVFAPLEGVGLMFVSRESHPALREERSPYYHVRDVALVRARLAEAVCVLSALCPSVESAALGLSQVVPAGRRWPPVEVVKPGPDGRAPRLVRVLRDARRAFLLAPVPGAGVARVCRSCRQPAACASCGGLLRQEEGTLRCVVCESPGRCANCGANDFGIRAGGRERVEEWVRRTVAIPVRRYGKPRLPDDAEVVIGGSETVRDLGVGGLDLVGIIDADLAEVRPGLSARERAVATWFEAAGWARPNGRVIVQATNARDTAVQALVRGNPERFHADESRRRAEAGLPVGAAVFRVAGSSDLPLALEALEPITLLVSEVEDQTICLLALEPERVHELGRLARELTKIGVVTRVEAEPHL